MLNRRHLRVKALQVLYSYQQSEVKEILPDVILEQNNEDVNHVLEQTDEYNNKVTDLKHFLEDEDMNRYRRLFNIEKINKLNERIITYPNGRKRKESFNKYDSKTRNVIRIIKKKV
jgi:hypothetical protein